MNVRVIVDGQREVYNYEMPQAPQEGDRIFNVAGGAWVFVISRAWLETKGGWIAEVRCQ